MSAVPSAGSGPSGPSNPNQGQPPQGPPPPPTPNTQRVVIDVNVSGIPTPPQGPPTTPNHAPTPPQEPQYPFPEFSAINLNDPEKGVNHTGALPGNVPENVAEVDAPLFTQDYVTHLNDELDALETFLGTADEHGNPINPGAIDHAYAGNHFARLTYGEYEQFGIRLVDAPAEGLVTNRVNGQPILEDDAYDHHVFVDSVNRLISNYAQYYALSESGQVNAPARADFEAYHERTMHLIDRTAELLHTRHMDEVAAQNPNAQINEEAQQRQIRSNIQNVITATLSQLGGEGTGGRLNHVFGLSAERVDMRNTKPENIHEDRLPLRIGNGENTGRSLFYRVGLGATATAAIVDSVANAGFFSTRGYVLAGVTLLGLGIRKGEELRRTHARLDEVEPTAQQQHLRDQITSGDAISAAQGAHGAYSVMLPNHADQNRPFIHPDNPQPAPNGLIGLIGEAFRDIQMKPHPESATYNGEQDGHDQLLSTFHPTAKARFWRGLGAFGTAALVFIAPAANNPTDAARIPDGQVRFGTEDGNGGNVIDTPELPGDENPEHQGGNLRDMLDPNGDGEIDR